MSFEKFNQFLANRTATLALEEKAEKHDVSVEVLEMVFARGIDAWSEETGKTPHQYAFNRVDSFLAGGLAAKIDQDLLEDDNLVDILASELKEGRNISDLVHYRVVHRETGKVIQKYTQRRKAMYHTSRSKQHMHTNVGTRVVDRHDHLGRKLDANGHIVESHFLDASIRIHNAHHEVSRRLAGSERDPELRRLDRHRAKKHKHASSMLEIIKARKAKK